MRPGRAPVAPSGHRASRPAAPPVRVTRRLLRLPSERGGSGCTVTTRGRVRGHAHPSVNASPVFCSSCRARCRERRRQRLEEREYTPRIWVYMPLLCWSLRALFLLVRENRGSVSRAPRNLSSGVCPSVSPGSGVGESSDVSSGVEVGDGGESVESSGPPESLGGEGGIRFPGLRATPAGRMVEEERLRQPAAHGPGRIRASRAGVAAVPTGRSLLTGLLHADRPLPAPVR